MNKTFIGKVAGFVLSLCMSIPANAAPAGSPVALNGKLHVSGTKLVNECGNTVRLSGMSTHGPQWFQNCYCKESLKAMVDDWGITIFRFAMYVQEQGYVTKPDYWRQQIDQYAEWCDELGIYFLIDWHVLNPGNPNANLNDAKQFWDYMSKKHASKKNVLYEICNEPNGVQWGTVKEYAEAIISTIRANDKETVIICGTPTWSQDVDIASQNKLSDKNTMYTLHFYAGSHGQQLRNKAEQAMNNGCAIFVTECGTSSASGDGSYSPGAMTEWVNWMTQHDISWCNWSFADKSEVASALNPGACNSRSWNNTTASGTLIKGFFKEKPFKFTACSSANSGNNNNNQQQQDPNQNNNNQNNNNNQQQQDPNQNNNNQNNNNNQQQQDPNQNNNNQNNNNNQQQQQPNVTYPNLENAVAKYKVYRIINKKSGMAMTLKGSTQDKAQLFQAARSENDESQLFELREFDGFYTLTNVKSRKVLTNSYNPNPGAQIVQQDLSSYDNPSEKFKFTKVDGNWFKIENKSGNNSCLAVENGSYNEGAAVLQANPGNADEQLWGFEYVADVDTTDVEILYNNNSIVLAPSVVNDLFMVAGEYESVDVISVDGVKVASFPAQDVYNVSNLSTGSYVVVVNAADGQHRFKIVKL
ncbi:MAG: cellulase family glycosylhydrolase [Paludibacteraceae bacterium]|nr:cellulase family glycosylhydrolase [Paludibacteraceae bacterium]